MKILSVIIDTCEMNKILKHLIRQAGVGSQQSAVDSERIEIYLEVEIDLLQRCTLMCVCFWERVQ
jgi:hypothetical protein